ncbi:MAG: NB-ARC domain-containing protein [Myxococcales bacterium]|nr:NB-ARC domain-containing protein [Myxococcales bacterium]
MAKPDGRLLRELRRRRGLTITALAARAGVAEKTVRLLEHDATPTPHPDTIAAVAGALNVEPEVLFATPVVPAPGPVSRPIWNVEALPAGTVERTGELTAARAALLRQKPPPVVLVAAGGYGKSTLAQALCHDPEVRDRFTDGCAWVTLGQRGNTLGALTKLYALLRGERPTFVDVEDAACAVETALRGRSLLLVLDDVWNPAHLRPFSRGGPACIVTTRDRDVAPVGALTIELCAMDETEAARVLHAQDPPSREDAELLRQVARRTGGFPLLLGLAGANLQQRLDGRGDTLRQGLLHLDAVLDRYGVEGFDHQRPAERSQAVSATLEASLSALSTTDRERFAELSVFAEDAPVPLDVLSRLWQLTSALTALDSELLLSRLRTLCLLREKAGDHAQLHDVIRQQLRTRLGQRRTEVALQAAQVLQERWREGDAFALDQLPYQLAEAGQSNLASALLLDFEWLSAKAGTRGWAPLLSDFDLAPAEPELQSLAQALMLTAPYAGSDRKALAQQLWGRLSPSDGARIEALLQTALTAGAAPAADAFETGVGARPRWLRPRTPSLSRPGGALLRVLRTQDSGSLAIDADRDGHVVMTGGGDGVVRLWDASRGEQLAAFRAHDHDIRCLSLSADGRRVATAAADGSPPRLWDVAKGKLLREFEAGWSWQRCRIDRDGARLFTGAGQVAIWVTSSQLPPDLLPRLGGAMAALVLSHDDRRIATTTYDSESIQLWDVHRGELAELLLGHEGSVSDVAFDRADGRLASVSVDGTLRLWPLQSDAPPAVLRHPRGVELEAVSWAANDTLVASGDAGGRLWLWQVEDGRLLGCLRAHDGPVSQLLPVGDGNRLASLATGEHARVWDLQRFGAQPSPRSAVRAIASAGPGRIAVGRADGAVELWDVSEAQRLRSFDVEEGVNALEWVADQNQLVAATETGALLAFDLEAAAGAPPRRLVGHAGAALCLANGGDGSLLSGGADRIIRRHRLDDGALLSETAPHEGAITALAVLWGGVVAANSAGELVALDRQGKRRTSHRVPGRWVRAMAARGEEVLFGGDDCVLGSWRPWREPAPEALAHLNYPLNALEPMWDDAWIGVDGRGDVIVWCAGEGLSTAFTDERGLHAVRALTDGRLVVAGGETGELHFLECLPES